MDRLIMYRTSDGKRILCNADTIRAGNAPRGYWKA